MRLVAASRQPTRWVLLVQPPLQRERSPSTRSYPASLGAIGDGRELNKAPREATMTFLNLSLGSPVVRAAETVTGELGVVGARFIVAGGPSNGRFSLVEHPIVPRGLAASVHVHRREDEFSFVLEGRWGFQLGSDVVYAEAGDLVYKPRDVAHVLERHGPAGTSPGDHLAGGLRGTLRRARRSPDDRPRQLRGRRGFGSEVRGRERSGGDHAGRCRARLDRAARVGSAQRFDIKLA